VGGHWVDVIRVLRNHFDPNQIMNPGGTLALDMTEEQKKKLWGLRK
jgi:alkyldihydroxyacetonephosphate synthase